MRNTYTSGELVGEGSRKETAVMKGREKEDERKKDESNDL